MIKYSTSEVDIENRKIITTLPEWKHDEVASKQTSLTQSLLQRFNNESLTTLVNGAHRTNDSIYQAYERYQQNQLFAEQKILVKEGKLEACYEGNSELFNLSWEEKVWARFSNYNNVISMVDLQAARDSMSGRIIQVWIKLNIRQSIIAAKIKQVISYGNARLLSSNLKSKTSYIVEYDKEMVKEKSNLAILERQQRADKKLMNVLTGDRLNIYLFGINDNDLSATLSTFNLTGLSASLIVARPDIQNAYAEIRKVDSKATVPLIALIPSFELDYAAYRDSNHFDFLISGSQAILMLNLLTRCLLFPESVKQTYNPGHRVDAAEKYLAFKRVLLKALQELKDCLIQEHLLVNRQRYVEKVTAQIESKLHNKILGIENNKENIRHMLSVEQEALHNQIQAFKIIMARLTNRIELNLSLEKGV